MDKIKILKWVLVVFWAGVIFFLSHQPYLKSGLPLEWDFALRKLAHITEYAVLSLLLAWAVSDFQIQRKHFFFLIILLPLIYAFSDEWHQGFIAGRVASLKDVLIDFIGVFIALAVVIKRKLFYYRE